MTIATFPNIDQIEDQDRPYVSVCLPVYNGMPYLKDAINSVLMQDFRDFELIISIDESSDGTKEFVENIYNDERIKVFYNDNPGLFQNLNNAISKSRGDLVQIFCQDDVMKPSMLSEQVDEMNLNDEICMVIARDETIYGDGSLGGQTFGSIDQKEMSRSLFLWRASHYASLSANISCLMIKRSAFKLAGLFDESYNYAGDVEFFTRIFEAGSIRNAAATTVFIRSHDRQTSRAAAASLGFLSEEERIYEGFWHAKLKESHWKRLKKFRAGTRGATHFRTGMRNILSGSIFNGAHIILETVRVYGMKETILRGVFRRYIASPILTQDQFDAY